MALAKSSLRDLLAAALEIARGGAVREGQVSSPTNGPNYNDVACFKILRTSY
jgi:hypothetical protein